MVNEKSVAPHVRNNRPDESGRKMKIIIEYLKSVVVDIVGSLLLVIEIFTGHQHGESHN